MLQLILHLVGDYVTQTSWMAANKNKASFPAFVHATVYSLPFLILNPSMIAFAIILGTHFFIDRFRLARYLIAFREKIFSKDFKYSDTTDCGFHKDTPAWLSTWLFIIIDNTLHLTCNYLALEFFPK